LGVEAKLPEDDGTARDKVTRVQHLAALHGRRRPVVLATSILALLICAERYGVIASS
jgi:hypothetical protein